MPSTSRNIIPTLNHCLCTALSPLKWIPTTGFVLLSSLVSTPERATKNWLIITLSVQCKSDALSNDGQNSASKNIQNARKTSISQPGLEEGPQCWRTMKKHAFSTPLCTKPSFAPHSQWSTCATSSKTSSASCKLTGGSWLPSKMENHPNHGWRASSSDTSSSHCAARSW